MPFDTDLTPAMCSSMAVLVSWQERAAFITFLLPFIKN